MGVFFARPFGFGTLPMPGPGDVRIMKQFRVPKRLPAGAFSVAAPCRTPSFTPKTGKDVVSVEKDKEKTSCLIRSANDNTEKDHKT